LQPKNTELNNSPPKKGKRKSRRIIFNTFLPGSM